MEAVITLRDPADRDPLVADSIPLQRATREEPGCLTYCFTADPVHDDRIVVVEAWTSPDALDEHLHHDNYRQMFRLLTSRTITDFSGQKHLVERSAPVYGDDGKPTGRFD